MKSMRRIMALLLTALLFLGSMPGDIASAMTFWCPDEGLSHKWGPTEWQDWGECGTIWGVHYCTRCGAGDEVSKERPHDWGAWQWDRGNKGTCIYEGSQTRICKRCGEGQDRSKYGDHKWGEWKTVKEATCTQEGKRERKCSLCGKKETESIAKKSHSYGAWVVVQEATENQVGIRERKCSKCGHVQREEFYPDGTLKRGDRGDEVAKLQEALNEKGYDAGKADGIFGKGTEGAVKEWQEDNGYEPDGILWPGQVNDLLGKDESENSPVRIELLLEYDCEPENGEYFTLGEPVGYVIRVFIEEGYTAKDLIVADLLYPQEIDGFPNAIEYFETATADDDLEWGYMHHVTASDVDSLMVINQAAAFWVDSVTGEEMKVISKVVRVSAGSKVRDGYVSGIDLELLTDCSQLSGMLGQKIPVRVKITNTGETTLTVNSSYMCDGSGNQPDSIDYVHWDRDTSSYDESSWFKGGSVMEGTLYVVVEQSDIDAGVIVRKYTQHARPFYAYVNGEITDVPADIEPRPEGTTGWRIKEEERVEDTIEVVIPLAMSGADQGYETAIDLELLTDTSAMAGNLGDTISVDVKVTNIGETIVTLNSHQMRDDRGTYFVDDNLHSWNEKAANPLSSWFKPGDTLTTQYDIVVTQADVDRGEIVRVLTQEAREFYYPNNEVARPDYVYTETGTLYTIWENPASDAVTIRIPIGDKNHVPEASGTALRLEAVTDYSEMIGTVGGELLIEVKVTNTGKDTLRLAYNQCYDDSGAWRAYEVDRFYWRTDERTDDPVNNFVAGDALYGMLRVRVTEEDLARGEIIREFVQAAAPHGDGSNRYIIEKLFIHIPIDSADRIYMEKSVVSAPLNGQYYVEGEQIEYEILVVNDELYEVHDLEVYDPLKGSNEDMMVNMYPVAGPLSGMKSWYTHVVTAEDVERGYVTNQAFARWYNPFSDTYGECVSNVVTVPVGGVGSTAEDAPMLTINKMVTNPPINGLYYGMGECIEYRLDITNTSATMPVYDVAVSDLLFSQIEENYVCRIDVLAPGETWTAYYHHWVTAEEAEAGYLDNSAEAYWLSGFDGYAQDTQSNVVTVETGYRTAGGLTITKKEISSPANGYFYIPGESVFFEVTVTNPTADIYTNVGVHDLLYDDSKFQAYDSIGAGFYQEWTLEFVVTEIDAAAGYLSNIAYVEGTNSVTGAAEMVYSPAITVPVNFDVPFGVITDLEIIKEETSTPANGMFYTEGETISYQITYTNVGEIRLGETLIYDSMDAPGSDEIASAEFLESGDSRTCYYEHVVDAADVARGYVINTAYAYSDVNGSTMVFISDIVESDTDGNPNTYYTPSYGTIDMEKLQGGSAGQAFCVCTIKSWNGENAVEYEAVFCPKHTAVQTTIDMMLKSAKSESELLMVWNYAFALYMPEVDAMYEVIQNASDEAAKMTLLIERVRFLALNGATRYAMTAASPDRQAEISEVAAKAWRDKMMDMCLEIGTAPAARPDSLLNLQVVAKNVEATDNCGCVVAQAGGGKMIYADVCCAVHGFTWRMTNMLLSGEVTVLTWSQLRTMWDLELRNAYTTLYKNADEHGGRAYLAEYAAFMDWMDSREAVVKMFYADDANMVAEIMLGSVIERTMDICERMK